MKKVNLKGKLSLSKESLVILNANDQQNLVGGQVVGYTRAVGCVTAPTQGSKCFISAFGQLSCMC